MSVNTWAERVVVGIDGSEQSKDAALWAAREAVSRKRGLTLVHAVMPPVTTSAFGVGLPSGLEMRDDLREHALKELDNIASSLPGDDIESRVELSSPSGALLTASETAALLVVGSRGLGGFKGLLLGSVGTQVAAHARCPVVVIRALPSPDARTVIVGIDATPSTQAALRFAFDAASRHGWRLVAVHAWDVPSYDLLVVPNAPIPVPLHDLADDEIRLAAEVLSGFQVEYPEVVVETRLVRGAPRQAVLAAATEAGLIVVGTRGHGQVIGAVLGSVSNAVLHHARVPVAVVPDDSESSAA